MSYRGRGRGRGQGDSGSGGGYRKRESGSGQHFSLQHHQRQSHSHSHSNGLNSFSGRQQSSHGVMRPQTMLHHQHQPQFQHYGRGGGYRMRLPERWLYCPKHGQPIYDVFIPMKTMLTNTFDELIPEDLRWTPDIALRKLKAMGVGLVIDLTKASRYYKPNEVEALGIRYQKILCEGHDGPPTDEQVDRFIGTCNAFIDQEEDKKIAVHCTHGFNRTGFMIVSYLAEQGTEIDLALELFSEARAPGIYKHDYVQRLVEKYQAEGDVSRFFLARRPPWSHKIPELAIAIAGAIAELNKPSPEDIDPKIVEQNLLQAFRFASDDRFYRVAQMYGWVGTSFKDNKVENAAELRDRLQAAMDAVTTELEGDGEADAPPSTETAIPSAPPAHNSATSANNAPSHGAHGDDAADPMTPDAPNSSKPNIAPSGAFVSPERDESEQAVALGKTTFLIDDPRVTVVTAPDLGPLRKSIREWCGGDKPRPFPGAQPISITRAHFNAIGGGQYLISHKADGVRYLMLIKGDGNLYLVGRDNSMFRISGFRFPSPDNLSDLLCDTLVDGELIKDVWRDKQGDHSRYRFYIFDCICVQGRVLREEVYMKRLEAIDRFVLRPRMKARIDTASDLFGVRKKHFLPFEDFGTRRWRDYWKSITHEKDGYLIVRNAHVYQPGSVDAQLKWKPPHQNSIDFQFVLDHEDEASLAVALCLQGKGGQLVQFTRAPTSLMLAEKEDDRMMLREKIGKIVECKWDAKSVSWKIMLVRQDKTHPNAYTTAERVWQTIQENLTENNLLIKANELRKAAEQAMLKKLPLDKKNAYKVAKDLFAAADTLHAFLERRKSEGGEDDHPTKRAHTSHASSSSRAGDAGDEPIIESATRSMVLLSKTASEIAARFGYDSSKRQFCGKVDPKLLHALASALRKYALNAPQ